MVYRVFVEKKPGLDHEARTLLENLRTFLGIQTLEGVRLFNRYDVENITPELFETARKTVFSEPQLDNTFDALPEHDGAVFAVEYLPGQFDQRADSAAQCIQLISCGDRRLGKVIETAWRKGETLSAWEDYFDLNRWMEAFEECGLDPHFYANRRRSEDEILPWSMISCGVAPGYLKREHALSYEGVTTPDCRTHCNACGANCLVGGKCDV